MVIIFMTAYSIVIVGGLAFLGWVLFAGEEKLMLKVFFGIIYLGAVITVLMMLGTLWWAAITHAY